MHLCSNGDYNNYLNIMHFLLQGIFGTSLFTAN